MRLAIMQPYLLPYIGYFQLIAHVDQFVIYDDIQYTKKGWINRNRFLRGGEPVTFTVPLQKDSDFLDIRDRRVADSYSAKKLMGQIEGAYRKAPQFSTAIPVLDSILNYKSATLYDFLQNGLKRICAHLQITTPLITSSTVRADTGLKGQERVIDLCRAVGASEYVNSIGGLELYSSPEFEKAGLGLQFLKTGAVVYEQFGQTFQPSLSILDVMMFNSVDQITEVLNTEFDLIKPVKA